MFSNSNTTEKYVEENFMLVKTKSINNFWEFYMKITEFDKI